MNYSRPLIYRLADRLEVQSKRGVEEVYGHAISIVRKYGAENVMATALNSLWQVRDKNDEISNLPWIALLIVKWSLQDNRVPLHVGKPMPLGVFENLKRQIFNAETLPPSPNAYLMIRGSLHGQLHFQRDMTFEFLRWPALIARLDSSKPIRRQFLSELGMEPEVFIDLSFALAGAIMRRDMPISPNWLESLRPRYGSALTRLFDLFARNPLELRFELQKEGAQRIRGKYELVEFPYLQRFPFLKMKDGKIQPWHRKVFVQGLNDAVHLRLSSRGEEYARAFSLVFEDYVTELLLESSLDVLTEESYKKTVGNNVSAVEALIGGPDCNILIEAKMGIFADEVMLADNEVQAYQKTKKLRDAITQAWRVGAFIRADNNPFGERFKKEKDYLFIVTSRDLLISGGEMLANMYAPNQLVYPDDNGEAKRRLPLSNIFILSIQDFENLMGCINNNSLDVFEFSKSVAALSANPSKVRLIFSEYLREHVSRFTLPKLIRRAASASVDRLADALGQERSTLDDNILDLD